MINVKKWLAALMTAAMIIGGIGFAGLAVSAADEPAPANKGAWSINGVFYDTLQLAYNNAEEGDTIVPTASNKENDDDLIAGYTSEKQTYYYTNRRTYAGRVYYDQTERVWYADANAPKSVIIDTKGINYTGEIKLAEGFQNLGEVEVPGNTQNLTNFYTPYSPYATHINSFVNPVFNSNTKVYGPYCIGENKGVYTIGEHKVKRVDWNWDIPGARAVPIEVCDSCGLTPRYDNPIPITVTSQYPVGAGCTEDRDVTYETTAAYKGYTGKTTVHVDKVDYHIYEYVPGSLQWVMDEETGLVKKDKDGKPIATAKVTCMYGDTEQFDVTPTVVKETLVKNATCMTFGSTTYTYKIELKALPSDRGNTADIPIKDAENKYIVLDYQTEKTEHIAGEPDHLEYLYIDDNGEEQWTTEIDEADDEDGTVKYRVAYQCIYDFEGSGHPAVNAEVEDKDHYLYVYGETLTNTPYKATDKLTSQLGGPGGTFCYYVDYAYKELTFDWVIYDGSAQAQGEQHASKPLRFGNANPMYNNNPFSGYASSDGFKRVVERNCYASANGTYKKSDTYPAGCGWYGDIQFTCSICGKTHNYGTTEDPMVAPTGNHTYEKNADGSDKIYTKPATCTEEGYEYKICTVCKAHDEAPGSRHDLKDDHTKTGKVASYITKVIPATGHKWALVANTDVTWRSGTTVIDPTDTATKYDPEAKVSVEARCVCTYEGRDAAPVTVKYYSWTYDAKNGDVKPDEFNVYDAITLDPKSTDCSEYDKLTYTVKDLKDMNDKPVTITVTSKNIGKHSYRQNLDWSTYDYATATLSLVCENSNCIEKGDAAQAPVKVIPCDVASAFNEDGSIKRTATCEGYDLTKVKNNPVDVFDLSKAVVTTNKVVSSQVVDNTKWFKADAETAKDIGLSVKVNGVELDKDIYEFHFDAAADSATNTVTIRPNVTTDETRPIVLTKKSNPFKVIEFGHFEPTDFTLKVDGLKENDRNFTTKIVYDGNDHTVEWAFNSSKVGKGATVKYAAMKAWTGQGDGPVPADEEFTLNAFTQKDVIECDIWVMVTKEEFITYKQRIVADFQIKALDVVVWIDPLTVKEGETPNPVYFIGDKNHKPLGINEDVLGIGIYTATGKPLTGLEPGQYVMKALSDNANVNIETRNGNAQLEDPVLTVLADPSGADKNAADKVAAMIDALTAASTPEEIQAAVDAYNALSDAAKALVPADKAAQLASYAIDTLNENSTPDQIKAVLNIYNALPDAAKAQVPADKVTKLNAAAEKAGLLQKDSSIKITNKAKAKVKRGKALKVTYKKTGDGKVTVKISGNKKVKKFFKVKGNSIKVAKKAKKGKYKVKVTVSIAATTAYKAAKATKTIKVTVK